MSSPAAGLGRTRTAFALPPGIGWSLAAALLLAGVVAGAALAFAPGPELARAAPTEDGFYALAVARHLGLGDGITVDGVARTNGFQPLWSFLCAPLYALVDGDRVLGLRLTQVLGTLLWLGFAGLLAVHTRDVARRHGMRGDVAAGLAAVVALGSVSVFRAFHNGLETGLLLVVVCAAVLVLDRVERWTTRRILAVGLLLGAVVWTRLDAVAFVAAVGLVAVVGSVRHTRRPPVGPLVACALAAVLLVPWLAYNVSLDGHLVPSGGRAQAFSPDPQQNATAAVRAVAGWILAPGFRVSLRPGYPGTTLLGLAAIGLLAAAMAFVARRAGGLRPGRGTVALWLYLLFLAGYYTVAHGSWWFLDRYLVVALILAVPWLAAAGERLLPRRALPAVAIAVAALNLPLFGVLHAAPREPPSWSAPLANTGTHPNLNWDQATWTVENVRADCRVGAIETGTLTYFRPNTRNLDGKVNPAALRAREEGRLSDYVERARIDVLVDIPFGVEVATRGRRGAWHAAEPVDDRFVVAVRRGREGCLRRTARTTSAG
jgi:hypothetical protein